MNKSVFFLFTIPFFSVSLQAEDHGVGRGKESILIRLEQPREYVLQDSPNIATLAGLVLPGELQLFDGDFESGFSSETVTIAQNTPC